MINISNLHVIFNPGTALENHALRGINLALDDKEFVVVIGSNGSGKSTLLRALSGEQPLSEGTISFAGNDVTKMPHHQRTKKVAQVFQNPLAGTCDELSIEENLALASRRGQRRTLKIAVTAKLREQFRAQLSLLGLGLENRLHDRVGLLSGGQRQALSLLMTSLAPCEILLLDEHTGALDPRMRDFILELTVKLYNSLGLSILMVTHSMHDALNYGSRTIMMHLGEIAFDLVGSERAAATIPGLIDKFTSLHDSRHLI